MADADASIDVNMLVDDVHDAQDGPQLDVEPVIISTNGAQDNTDLEPTTMQFDIAPTLSTSCSRPFHEAFPVPFSSFGEVLNEKAVKRDGLAVIVPPAQNRWEYKVFEEDDEVEEILEEYDDAGFLEYLVLFTDGSEDVVSLSPASFILQHIH